MTDSGSGRKKWYLAAAAFIVGLVAFLNSVFDLGERIFSESDAGAAAPSTAASNAPASPGRSSLSAQPDKPQEPTDPDINGTAARVPDSTGSVTSQGRKSGPAWYNLTAYDAVSFGNGHSSVSSITIGTVSYPNSIRGYYQSSASDPNDRRTWLTAGACDRLSVWVGKDAASAGAGGVGHFSVQAEGVEIAGADAKLNDPPQHLDVDIKGVSRLTLLDTKASRDANNAWGSPKVHCTTPPGKAR